MRTYITVMTGAIIIILLLTVLFRLIFAILNKGIKLQKSYYWYVVFALYKNNYQASLHDIATTIGLSENKTAFVLSHLLAEEVVDIANTTRSDLGDAKIVLTHIGRKVFEDNVETLRAAGWQTQLDELGL